MVLEELKAKMQARIELAASMQKGNISDTSKRYYQGIEETARETLKIVNEHISKEYELFI